MKKLLYLFFAGFFATLLPVCTKPKISTSARAESQKLQIAFVIDDFGSEDRHGVEEMLALSVPLTCAIMPGLINSENDAHAAHARGHEVILHMPMEASTPLPESWYGPKVVKNHFTGEQAVALVDECIKSIPYAVGMNIHIGTGVSSNEEILSSIMLYMKSENLYFLDSKTTEATKCQQCATTTGFNLLTRDIFIENHFDHSYGFAKKSIQKAIEIAKDKGFAIVIGHVGPEGGNTTVNAIKDSVEDIKNAGIEIVKLSEIYNRTKKSI